MEINYRKLKLVGMFIVRSFSYGGTFIAKEYHFNYLSIGFIMTGFGIMYVIGGRISGKLSLKIGPRKVLTIGLYLVMF